MFEQLLKRINYGHLDPTDLTAQQLAAANEEGWTVAHELARKGNLPQPRITPAVFFVEAGIRHRIYHWQV